MNNQAIKINTIGKILSGGYTGWYVYVEDDSEYTGGYLIHTCIDPDIYDTREGYDSWAEDLSSVENYFKESNWTIEWLE